MVYDHHVKAGNQGDCVKHAPLIAALDEALNNTRASNGAFHYLDVFAGHAWHPLVNEKGYGWRKGIGRLALAELPETAPDCIRNWWNFWHTGPNWPGTNPPGYPGSSWIAAQRCRQAGRAVKLELFDHSQEARRDLECAFPAAQAIQDGSPSTCVIGQSLNPTEQMQDYIRQADLNSSPA